MGAYLVLSVLWILLSDQALGWFVHDLEELTWAQSAKGLFFVVASALVLFGLLARELHQRRRTEVRLGHSDARFRAAFDSSSVYMMLVRRDDETIFDINRAWARALGFDRDELLGKTLAEVGIEPERPNGAMLRVALREGRSFSGFEHELRTRSGEKLYVVTCGDPVALDHQPCWLLVASDVTNLRRSQQKLRDLERQFQQAQKMEALGTLAGGVAHDFNNLLGLIMSYADFAQESLPDAHPSRDDIAEIISAGKRATGLTQQLLAFCRQQATEPVPVDVSAAFRDLRKMMRRLIGEDIELEVWAAPDLPCIFIDPQLFDQALINLAVNARDAMPRGGRLSIRAELARHEDDPSGAWVRVRVRDDGCGMDETTRSRAFEPFFTTKGHERGTGLGLSLVFGAVTQSGGSITVESAPGEGTTFDLWFRPADRAAVGAAQLRASQSRDLGGSESILVVEDDASVRELVSRILDRHGYEVLTAADAREALMLIEGPEHRIDMVLSDVVLPRMSGAELGRVLSSRAPRVPVLFMTGYVDETTRRHGLAEPHELHLIRKPFTPSELVTRVRALLDTPPSDSNDHPIPG